MTELRSYKIRQFAKPHQLSSISPPIWQEVPLLAAIAHELRQADDDVRRLFCTAAKCRWGECGNSGL